MKQKCASTVLSKSKDLNQHLLFINLKAKILKGG